MTVKTMNKPNPSLTAYMNYASDEGLNLYRFVEHGGRLVGGEDSAGLAAGLAELREKIAQLRPIHPRLARQLEFLANLFETDAAQPAEAVRWLPEAARNETAFALLYAAKDMDLVPDDMPQVGYLDDIAVTEIVLNRHAAVFEQQCAARGIDWATIEPEPTD
ncbi:MAG: YkvA family protein [Chthoniobacteraceae bacterium]